MTQTHISHASGSGDGVDTQSKVPDEPTKEQSGTDEGAGSKPEVPDVPKYKSDSEEESWTFSEGDDDEDDANDESDAQDDDANEDDDDGDDFVHPNLSTFTKDDEEEKDENEDDDEEISDQRVYTPPDYQSSKESEKQEDDDMDQGAEEEHDDEEMLYGDLNINLERRDAEMTEAHVTTDTEDTQVNPNAVTPAVQQQGSSASSDLVSKFINTSQDEGIESVFNKETLVDTSVTTATETPFLITSIHQPHVPITQTTQQIPTTTTTTTLPTTMQPEIPDFASIFGFDQRVSALESDVSSLKNSNPFAEAVSSIPRIVDAYLRSKLKETVDVAVQLKSNKLREEVQAKNQEFLNSLDSNMQKIIKEQVKAKTSKIMSKVEKYVTETLEAEVLVRSTNQPQMSYGVATSLLELELKKILMDKIEENKPIDRSEVQKNLYNALVEAYNSDKDLISSYGDVVIIPTTHDDKDKDEGPSAGSNRGSKRRRSDKEAESSREPSHKESRTTSSSRGATRSQPTNLEDLSHQEFTTGGNEVTPVRETHAERQWHPSSSPTLDREWNQTKTVSD
ncbi:hypothetical protein Tco_0908109 [Tanacetum coccineum]|uniref:Uncharacterized protein n=1 Tax=Tanacetum coccineum TaxID=301880 RepID=A0ABQ5CSP0_9ASTR